MGVCVCVCVCDRSSLSHITLHNVYTCQGSLLYTLEDWDPGNEGNRIVNPPDTKEGQGSKQGTSEEQGRNSFCYLLVPPPSLLSLCLAGIPCFILFIFELALVWFCFFVLLSYVRKWWEESIGLGRDTGYFSCCYLVLKFLLHH